MKRFLTTILFCFVISSLFSQSRKLTNVIKDSETKFNVSFSFDADLIKNHYTSITSNDKSLEEFIIQLSNETGFIIELVDSGNVILKRDKAKIVKKCVTIQESDSKEIVSGIIGYIIGNESNGGVSDDGGQICLSDKVYPSDLLVIKGYGYKQKTIPIKDVLDGNVIISIESEEVVADDINLKIILTSGIEINPQNHGIEIKTEDLALLPGETAGDVLESIQILPGITSGNGKSGNLQVRGSTVDQTLIMLDDIPIYHKGHFYGTLSPFNSDAIESIKVFRSGYHPKYGGRVGGTIDVRTKNHVPDSSQYGFGINTLFASGFTDVKLDKKGKVGLLLSGRSFLPISWGLPKQKAIAELARHITRNSAAKEDDNIDIVDHSIIVNDINAKLNINPDSTQNIDLSFFRINNRDFHKYRTSNNHKLNEIADLKNIGSSIRWDKKVSQKSSISMVGVLSDYSYQLFSNRLNQSDIEVLKHDQNVNVQDLHTKLIYSHQVGKKDGNSIDFGYSYVWQQAILDINDRFDPVNTFKTRSLAIGKQNVFFTNYKCQVNDKLNANIGTRLVHFNRTNKIGIEPRLNLSYSLNEELSLKSSFGYYEQYLNQLVFFDFNDIRVENHTWDLSGDRRSTVNNLQGMVGFTVDKKGWLFDAEFYSKTIQDLQVSAGFPGSANEFSTGNGKVLGTDILIRKRWKLFDIWASYTYNFNRWKFSVVSEEEFRPYYDQPHIFSVAGSMNYKKWKYSIGWYLKSGIPDQSVSTGFALGPPGAPQPLPGVTYNGRFQNVHQMDVSVLYEFINSKDWRGNIGLSIQNLYNQNNIIEEGRIKFDPGSPTFQQTRSLIGFAPNMNINIYW